VVIASCERTVVRLDAARAASKLARWRKIAREAARQAHRADTPEVDALRWDDAVTSLASPAARAFCLWEKARSPLGPPLAAALADANTRPLAFAVGPEGGLTEREVETARASGFIIVSLGDIVLRTETVCAAVLGALRVMSFTA
jgi:16S rRNA (uracil1498-N3)-methyltransferase